MKGKVGVGFVALCLWAGSAWLYDLISPGVLTGLPRTALHNGLVALGCFGWAVWHRDRSPAPRAVAKLAAGAVFMFALPEIVLAGASAHVTQSTEVLVFMLVPAVVVFWLGQQSAAFGADGGSLRGLVPALSGLGGAALILPFSLPSSWMGRLWLAALVVSAIAAGVAAVAMHRLLAKISLARAGSVVFGVSSLLTASFAAIDWHGLPAFSSSGLACEVLRLLLIDGPILLLGLWLLREMRPVAFSARLLLVPAVTLLEGVVAERPEVGWYGWLGLLLTVGSAVVLLASGGETRNADGL
jgi:drug/metabolite transporter (DMT)-like permease